MSRCLCDTSGKDDIHINDVLIQEGHAQFVVDNPDLVYAEDPQVVCNTYPDLPFPPINVPTNAFFLIYTLQIVYSGFLLLHFSRWLEKIT